MGNHSTSGGGGGGDIIINEGNPVVLSVTQTTHGFTLPPHGFIPVVRQSGAYVAATADDVDNAADMFIVGIPDADSLEMASSAELTVPGHGLTVGSHIALSNATAGEIVTQESLSAGDNLQHLGYVTDTNGISLDLAPIRMGAGPE